jgi:hypothetical protein
MFSPAFCVGALIYLYVHVSSVGSVDDAEGQRRMEGYLADMTIDRLVTFREDSFTQETQLAVCRISCGGLNECDLVHFCACSACSRRAMISVYFAILRTELLKAIRKRRNALIA